MTVLDWVVIGALMLVAASLVIARLADMERRLTDRLQLISLQQRVLEKAMDRASPLGRERSETL